MICFGDSVFAGMVLRALNPILLHNNLWISSLEDPLGHKMGQKYLNKMNRPIQNCGHGSTLEIDGQLRRILVANGWLSSMHQQGMKKESMCHVSVFV